MTAPDPARILRPRRPRLAEALACVSRLDLALWASDVKLRVRADGVFADVGRSDPPFYPWEIHDPAEAWEVLSARDVIPAAWVQNPARAFACVECEGRGRDAPVRPHPLEIYDRHGRRPEHPAQDQAED